MRGVPDLDLVAYKFRLCSNIVSMCFPDETLNFHRLCLFRYFGIKQYDDTKF